MTDAARKPDAQRQHAKRVREKLGRRMVRFNFCFEDDDERDGAEVRVKSPWPRWIA